MKNLCIWPAGYKDEVIHVSFLQIFCDGIFADFGEEDHVIHSADLHILGLPVIFFLTPLKIIIIIYCYKLNIIFHNININIYYEI